MGQGASRRSPPRASARPATGAGGSPIRLPTAPSSARNSETGSLGSYSRKLISNRAAAPVGWAIPSTRDERRSRQDESPGRRSQNQVFRLLVATTGILACWRQERRGEDLVRNSPSKLRDAARAEVHRPSKGKPGMSATHLSTRVLAALCGASVLSLLTLAVVSGPALATTPHGCPDVTFIGARGSGEAAKKSNRGLGEPVFEMAKLLQTKVDDYGETMGMVPVPYDADSVGELIPSKAEAVAFAADASTVALGLYLDRHVRPYTASINDGVKLTIEAVRATLADCPETEVVLAGYSQGAMAVHQAERQLEHEGDEESLDAIGGTLLLGDGDRTPLTKAKLVGGASRLTPGIRVALHGILRPQDVQEPETTVEICAVNDIVCDFSPSSIVHGALGAIKIGVEVHTSYMANPAEKAYLGEAVDWLAGEMGLTG
jgi:Cutinase